VCRLGLVERFGRGIAVLTALAAAGSSACAAAYVPRPSHYILHDADDRYHRDGQEIGVGLLGGGAERLVSGDARALEHARRAQHQMRLGWGLYGAGFASLFVGAAAAGAWPHDRLKEGTAFGVMGLGAAVSLVGVWFTMKGGASLVDAINVYNDDLDARAVPP
jgi:hypothetical protein